MARHTLPEDFRVALPSQTRVILIEAADRILGALPLDLSEKARQALTKLGVTVRTGTKVVEITHTCVVVEVPAGVQERIRCQVAMWAAGVKASALSHMLHERTGVALDRAGRVQVAPDLSIPHYPTLFVVGDMVHLEHADVHCRGWPGGHAARRPCGTADPATIARGATHRTVPLRGPGTMATIGRARQSPICGQASERLPGVAHLALRPSHVSRAYKNFLFVLPLCPLSRDQGGAQGSEGKQVDPSGRVW